MVVIAVMRSGLDFYAQVICMSEQETAQAPLSSNAVWEWGCQSAQS